MQSCSCSDYECDEYAELYFVSIRKARKAHGCCECGCVIEPGETYEHVFGVFDGDPFYEKTCLLCKRIRDDLAPNVCHTSLRDCIRDCKGIDYVTGELEPWAEEEDNTAVV